MGDCVPASWPSTASWPSYCLLAFYCLLASYCSFLPTVPLPLGAPLYPPFSLSLAPLLTPSPTPCRVLLCNVVQNLRGGPNVIQLLDTVRDPGSKTPSLGPLLSPSLLQCAGRKAMAQSDTTERHHRAVLWHVHMLVRTLCTTCPASGFFLASTGLPHSRVPCGPRERERVWRQPRVLVPGYLAHLPHASTHVLPRTQCSSTLPTRTSSSCTRR